MSDNQQPESIVLNPQFQQMVKRRHCMVWGLSIAVLVLNILYILVMSYLPGQFAEPLYEGGYITYGVLYYLLVIAFGIGAPAYYSWWSGRHLDPMKRKLLISLKEQARGDDNE